jgi:23S rRNA pseudouridine2605 synthase
MKQSKSYHQQTFGKKIKPVKDTLSNKKWKKMMDNENGEKVEKLSRKNNDNRSGSADLRGIQQAYKKRKQLADKEDKMYNKKEGFNKDSRNTSRGTNSTYGKRNTDGKPSRYDNNKDDLGFRKDRSNAGDKPFRKTFDKPNTEKENYSRDRKPFTDGPKREGRREFSDNKFEKRPYTKRDDNNFSGERKPYTRRGEEGGNFEKRPYTKRDDSNFSGERKPYNRRNEEGGNFEKRPYTKRDDNNFSGERKPLPRKKVDNGNFEKKSFKDRDGKKTSFEKKPSARNTEKKSLDYSSFEGEENKAALRKLKRYEEDAYEANFNSSRNKFENKKFEDLDKQQEQMPLNKYISHCGICSRREAVEIIKEGRVSVNKIVEENPAYKVEDNDIITLDGKKILPKNNLVYLLLNKPKDFITTNNDPEGRKTVLDLVANATEERVYPVGRLDRNTSGLLLLTNDGELAQKLSHPKYKIQKLYQVNLDKQLNKDDFNTILAGLELEDGKAEVDELAYIDSADKTKIGIQIHSGKNRIVRRIFESLGYKVKQLDRVMYANLTKKNLPRGNWRFLTQAEIRFLKVYNSNSK